MADISKITTLDGTEYDIKDATARSLISNLPVNNLQNLVDGNRDGSVRGIYTKIEDSNYVMGFYAFAEGYQTKASGLDAHAEGSSTEALGTDSHAEGLHTIANSLGQHVFGLYNIADPRAAINTKGTYVEIVGNGENENTRSNARTLDWDGNEVLAGKLTIGTAPVNAMDVTTKQYVDTAIANKSSVTNLVNGSAAGSVRGINTTAENENYTMGENAFAEGLTTQASGNNSHAEGSNTIANHASQHVFGKYNIADDSEAAATVSGNYVEIVGNGSSSARSNARTLDWSGNEVLAGTLTTGFAPEAEGDTTHKVGIIVKSDIDPDTAPEDSQWYRVFSVKDINNEVRSYLAAIDTASYGQGVQIETKRVVNGSDVYNGLQLRIQADGTRNVAVSDSAIWRKALDLGTNGALPITVAQGGTGVTTATKNQVFAAPNGSNGAPGFRALVAADIPTLATSKISGLDTALDGKVAIAGDTMTGNLTISKASESMLYLRNTAAALGTAPGSDAYTGQLGFRTNTNVTIGWVDNHYSKNKESITRIAARNTGTGSNVDNSLSLGVANDGTRLVSMTAPSVWRTALGLGAAATRAVDTTPTSGATDLITSGGVYTALDGKVSTGGDTMTGNLTMKGASVPIRQSTAKVGTTPGSTLYTGMFAAQDSNGTNIGYVRGFFGTDGATGMQFECVRAVSGSNKYHNLSLRMKADGTRQVTVTEKEPWLSGLGLAPTNITSSVTKVTTMPSGISKINTLTVWRSGYLVQVYISVLPTASPPTAWVNIASGLPAPALAPIVNGRYWENSTAQPALFQVSSDGHLQVAWGAGSKNQVATLVYIAKEL